MNFQTDNLLKLGYSELQMRNFAEAEKYFKQVLERENSSSAWVGLGKTRLNYLQHHLCDNPENNSSIINNSFACFDQARREKEVFAEMNEIFAIDTSFQVLTNLYKLMKKLADDAKGKDKMQNTLLLAGLFANAVHKRGDEINHLAINNIQERNITVGAFKVAFQVASQLRDTTIQFVEYAIERRDRFITAVADMEYDLNWYVMDEKEKKKIERERAKQAKNNEQKKVTDGRKKAQSNWDKPEWQGGIIVMMLLIAYLIYKNFIDR